MRSPTRPHHGDAIPEFKNGVFTKAAKEKRLILADEMWRTKYKGQNQRFKDITEYAVKQAVEADNPYYILALQNMNHAPVTIDEFIQSEEFLGCDPDFKLWSTLQDDVRAINADIFTGAPAVVEAYDGGATGSGKSHIANLTQLYQCYLVNCFDKPYKLWPALSPRTPLVMMFQSVQEGITRRVLYEPFYQMFTEMPFVRKHLQWNTEKENMLEFVNGVRVLPALASLQKMIGQAIFSCILDEVNFMAVVQDSKQAIGNRGESGVFNQAEIVYTNITRRRKSRMRTKGPNPGVINVLSSTRYLDDFMDKRMREAQELIEEKGKAASGMHVMRRKQYEAQPQDQYDGRKIKVLVGSVEYGTRILKTDEIPGKHYPATATVLDVPIEYENDFRRDPEGALRDVCGIATDVIAPFFTQRHKIVESIMRGVKLGLQPWVLKADVELDTDGMPQINEDVLNAIPDKGKPRFVHIDLAKNKDRCGIAIVKVSGMQAVNNGGGIVEYVPHFCLEQAISIKPSKANELDIGEVRKWIMALKEYYGINIHTVSLDGFQSQESMQQFRKAGIMSQYVSMDTTTEPYDHLKMAIYQDRFDCQDHELLKVELAGLEINSKKEKVDHGPHGSKDISDAVAGACFTASQNRTVRSLTGVSNTAGEAGGSKGRAGPAQRGRSVTRRVRR